VAAAIPAAIAAHNCVALEPDTADRTMCLPYTIMYVGYCLPCRRSKPLAPTAGSPAYRTALCCARRCWRFESRPAVPCCVVSCCAILQQSDPGDIPTEWSETCLYRATFKVGDLSSAVTYANWDNLQRAGGLPVQATPAAAAAAAGAAARNAGARTALTFRDIQVAGEQNVKSPLLLVPSELDLYMHFQPPEVRQECGPVLDQFGPEVDRQQPTSKVCMPCSTFPCSVVLMKMPRVIGC
jgi:hypothetical protein